MLRGKICNAEEDYVLAGRGKKKKIRGVSM